MIEAAKFLAPKRFGVTAYVCLIVHFLCGLAFIGVTWELRKGEFAKFGCTADKQRAPAAYKSSVEKICYARYEQAYNSPLSLYAFVSLSIGFTVFVSLIYSLGVRASVEKIDRALNESDEPRTDIEGTSEGFYVFYFYFFHLVARSVFGILFTVLQYTVFYPRGFASKFNCNPPTSDVTLRRGNNTIIGKLNYSNFCGRCSLRSIRSILVKVLKDEQNLWTVVPGVFSTALLFLKVQTHRTRLDNATRFFDFHRPITLVRV